MQKLSLITGLSLLLLTGCAKQAPVSAVTPAPSPVVASQSVAPIKEAQFESKNMQGKHIEECRKQLDAMQVYSKASYNKYQAELQKLSTTTNKYLQVKESIGADINDIVMPQKEFQTRELCFRIKSRLMQLMIKQA